nr:unnamed protein product [Callosobruchus analis]
MKTKKKEVRKVVVEEKRERRKTGGGAYIQKHENDPCYGKIIDRVNSKTIYGLENAYDGDGIGRVSMPLVSTTGDMNIVNVGDHNSINDNNNNVADDSEIITIIGIDEPGTSDSSNKVNWTGYKPDDLKQPRPTNLSTWSNRRRPKIIEPVHTNVISKQYSNVAELKKTYNKKFPLMNNFIISIDE